MLPPGLLSARQVSQYYDSRYFDRITSGRYYPFIYPLVTLGAFAIFLYLLIDHRGSHLRSSSRYVVFALFTAFQAWCVFKCTARNPAAAYGLGIVSSFSWLWVATHVIINDCQVEYKRLQRRPNDSSASAKVKPEADGNAGDLFYWQSYPASFGERLHWVMDMFISFRGVGWSWQTAGVPDLPAWAKARTGEKGSAEQTDEVTTSRTGLRRFSNRKALVKDSAIAAVLGYLAMDALKTFTMHDPYFWGYTNAGPPSFYPSVIEQSQVLLKMTRLIIMMLFTSTALRTIFKLGPIFFAGILGPNLIGLSGEAIMNPADMFGSFSNVFDKGLAGFWGGYWHQVFRYTFEAPGTRLLEVLNIKKKSTAGKMIALFVAFAISGGLHACGSYTQTGDTRPLLGPFRFFILQGVGIALETLAWGALKSAGVSLPRFLDRTLKFSYTLFWLYHTGPLISDDFSQGGVWLFEPVPISIFRGLGFGIQDTGWVCWGEDFASWYSGKYWIDAGLSL